MVKVSITLVPHVVRTDLLEAAGRHRRHDDDGSSTVGLFTFWSVVFLDF